MAEVRKQTAIRLTDSEKAEITRRAGERGLTLTGFMIRAALGTLDDPPEDWRLDIERRLRALEELLHG